MSIHRGGVKKDPDRVVEKITSPCSWVPYFIAALIAILFSFFEPLKVFLINLPKPVIGGMELFLFGIISAPGIQLLVEQRVNYKKTSNQLITAAVLISGISGISVKLGTVEFEGMSLGFLVGVILNIVVKFIKWLGATSDVVTFEEMAGECMSAFDENSKYRVLGYRQDGHTTVNRERGGNIYGFAYALSGRDCRIRMMPSGDYISDDTLRDEISHTDLIEIGLSGTDDAVIRLRKTRNGMFLEVKSDVIDSELKKAYLNDYDEIDEDGNWLLINASSTIPMRKLTDLLRIIDTGSVKKQRKKKKKTDDAAKK